MLTLTSRPVFVDRLADFGNTPALFSGEEVVSYADLDARVTAASDRLGRSRRLVLVHGDNTVESVVAYLGALRGGHAVILLDAARRSQDNELGRRFDPDVVIRPDGWDERRLITRHALHPDLRLLLSTSGSTGSPKLVRLSATNLSSNAASIVEYLRLTASDRALTSLPLAYSYGLSVIHSHLAVGAGLVLTQGSVIEPDTWSLARRHGITSFAGVPHTFALLDRAAQPWYAVPSLRYVTCAGGRLDPREVHRLSTLGGQHGWHLYVMYGQTEATARMAYLEPTDAIEHPDCIGRAVPGGALRVDKPNADGVGDLVYSGPNVMMGYAEANTDLGKGCLLNELRTGDLGRQRDNGLLQVVGRTSRMAKLLGHRIDLDRAQSTLSSFDPTVVCLSDDAKLLIAVTTGDALLIRTAAVRLTGLPPALVSVRQYDHLPLLPNGKPDLQALRRPLSGCDERPDLLADLLAAYAEVLGYDRVDPDASFVRLGGDSLSFVEMAVRIEELLGRLPASWPELTIRELAGLARPVAPETDFSIGRQQAPSAAQSVQSFLRSRFGAAPLDTSLVLRALAIAAIVVTHLEVTAVRGGAHLLLAVAGYTFARFPLAAVRDNDGIGGMARSIARLAVPIITYIGLVVALTGEYSVANIVLLNHVFGPTHWTQTWDFWFAEVLVTILICLAILLAVPAIRRLERRNRIILPASLLGVGLLLRPDVLGPADATMRFGRPQLVFWLFALGWLIHVSDTKAGRLLVSALVVVTLVSYFPGEPVRELVVQAGLLLLIWLPVLPVPQLFTSVLRMLATASLWIYMTHWIVWPRLLDLGVPRLAVVAACLMMGVAANWTVGRVQSKVGRVSRKIQSAASAPAGSRRLGGDVPVRAAPTDVSEALETSSRTA